MEQDFWQARSRLTLELIAAEECGDNASACQIARELKTKCPSPKKTCEDFFSPALRVWLRSWRRTFITFGFWRGLLWRLKSFFGWQKNLLPHTPCHRIILPHGELLLGSAPFAAAEAPRPFEVTLADLKKVLKLGQKLYIVSLMAPEEYYDKNGAILRVRGVSLATRSDFTPEIVLLRLSTFDHSFTDSMNGGAPKERVTAVKQILKKIHAALLANDIVYVHCWAGQERSATLVAAYLMMYHGLKWADAVAKIHKERPFVKKTLLLEQEEFLKIIMSQANYFI